MNGSSFVLDFQVTSKLFTNIFKCTADIFKREVRDKLSGNVLSG